MVTRVRSRRISVEQLADQRPGGRVGAVTGADLVGQIVVDVEALWGRRLARAHAARTAVTAGRGPRGERPARTAPPGRCASRRASARRLAASRPPSRPRELVAALGPDGLAGLEVDDEVERRVRARSGRQSDTRCISMRLSAALNQAWWRKASGSKSASRLRFTTFRILRLNRAVTPAASLYAASSTRTSFTRSTPTRSRSPGPSSARMGSSNACRASGSGCRSCCRGTARDGGRPRAARAAGGARSRR